MEIFARFSWDNNKVADLVPALLGFYEGDLGPNAATTESLVTVGAHGSFDARDLAKVQLNTVSASLTRFDDWLRSGKANSFTVGHLSMTPSFRFAIAGGEGEDGSGTLTWALNDVSLAERNTAPGCITDLLAKVSSQLHVFFAGCSGDHGYGVGAYARVAKPHALWTSDDSVLVDHDWQIVVPPAALVKLSRSRVIDAAASGEYREVDMPSGLGAVARLADDVSAITAEQWRIWRDALGPALVEHERINRPLRAPPPPHVAKEDWTVMTHAEIDEHMKNG